MFAQIKRVNDQLYNSSGEITFCLKNTVCFANMWKFFAIYSKRSRSFLRHLYPEQRLWWHKAFFNTHGKRDWSFPFIVCTGSGNGLTPTTNDSFEFKFRGAPKSHSHGSSLQQELVARCCADVSRKPTDGGLICQDAARNG